MAQAAVHEVCIYIFPKFSTICDYVKFSIFRLWICSIWARTETDYSLSINNTISIIFIPLCRRNILPWFTKKFLYQCRYRPDHTEFKFCPIFKVGTIVNLSTSNVRRLLTYVRSALNCLQSKPYTISWKMHETIGFFDVRA